MGVDDASKPEGAAALRKENKRLTRQIRQLERVFRTSEAMARQSRSAVQRSLLNLQKQTNDLALAKEAAEAGLAAKDRFLATMSHEIRTPMNGVIGCIDILTMGQLGDEERGLVNTLKDSAENLMALLNDVLDFAKLQDGQTVVESCSIDIAHLVNGVCAPEKARCTMKKIDVNFTIDPDLPKEFLGDPHRLRQVLGNLIGNAIKFTSTGTISINVESADEGRRIYFEVRDTGIGMKPEVLGSIFGAFTQADESTARRFGGTGLGLAISAALVAAMGGLLEVASEVDEGSRFYFSIPLEVQTAAEILDTPDASAEASLQEALSTQMFTGMRVLLVDDNPVNRIVGRKLIERLGCTVELASSGVEGAFMALDDDWDAVLMDCSMPEVDGFQATAMIRDMDCPRSMVRIIALTALTMQGDRERCLEAGMDDYMQKPLRLPHLRAALVRATEQKEDAA